MSDIRQRLSEIPGMDIILNYDWVQAWIEKLGRIRVKHVINGELSVIRRSIIEDESAEFNDIQMKIWDIVPPFI